MDMSTHKNIKLYTIAYMLLICCTLLLTFPAIASSDDDWVLIERYEHFTTYYNSKSINIDTQNNIIAVWMKGVFTDKGINDIIKFYIKDKLFADEIKNVNNQKILYGFNYRKWQYSINHITLYSNSGNVLMDWDISPEWKDIIADSYFDIILNKLLSNYDIKK
jgi:hypothetical protein